MQLVVWRAGDKTNRSQPTRISQSSYHQYLFFYFRRVGRRIGERRASGSREAKGI